MTAADLAAQAQRAAAEFAEWERSLPGIVRRQAGILPGPPYVQENNDGENK